MGNRVLVVDDEDRIREIVRSYLEREGFEVTEAPDGEAGLRLASDWHPDLVVLDVMMPGTDGLEVLRRLRSTSNVPVILLTARSDEVDTLVGLSVGADDYMTKPFRPRELVARIKTVLRRASSVTGSEPADRLVFEGLVIDVGAREVHRADQAVTLTTLEFDLLTALARAPGRVLSRRQLLESVWGFDFFGDERVVDVHIRSIRKALGDSAEDPELIGTVRGVGYKFLGTRGMRVWRRLDVRLFASYALVALVVFGALAVTVRIVAPTRFDDDIKTVTQTPEDGESHNVFVASLDSALWIALAVSIGAAAIVSTLVARRIVRPVRQVRDATRRLANGHYDERVAEPGELELAELARDVNRLAVELETTERRRARLVSEVAHEMRTPLTMIEGYVEGMLDGVFEPNEEVLVAVGEEASRLQRLASDLADLSRAEEGAVALHTRVVDLGQLAAASAERLRPQFEEKSVALVVGSGPPLPVEVDPERIAQVLTNLFGNALTYTPTGGKVEVVVGRDHDVASVAVSDTGIGLSPEDLALVFDRFYRVQGPLRPPGGSGIGLTIARGLARAHRGDIQVTSAGVGAGSVFTLTLPMARAAGSSRPAGEMDS